MNKKEIEEIRQGVGTMAEMALIFFRASLGAGATIEEAAKTTQAYLAAIMFGKQSEQPEDK